MVQAPLDVRLAPNRILQPDAMVLLRALAVDAPTPLDVVPDICIEVLSGNRAYDRVTKRYLYGEAGVREYWLVDPGGVVERRSGENLVDLELHDTRLESPFLPGFVIDLPRLFAKFVNRAQCCPPKSGRVITANATASL